jgi:hypothetical protein
MARLTHRDLIYAFLQVAPEAVLPLGATLPLDHVGGCLGPAFGPRHRHHVLWHRATMLRRLRVYFVYDR